MIPDNTLFPGVPRVFDPNAKTLSYAGKNYIFSAIKLNFMAAQVRFGVKFDTISSKVALYISPLYTQILTNSICWMV